MTWKERRTVTILSAILLALFAAVLILLSVRYQANRDQPDGEAEPAMHPGEVADQSAYTALSYGNGSASLSFSLDGEGRWIWSDDPSFPLDGTAVTAILRELSAWKPQQTVTDAGVLSGAGFDAPSATLTASTERGEVSLVFGRATTDGQSRYVRLNGDETAAYIMEGTLYELLSVPIYDMMVLPELPELTEERMKSVTLQGPGTPGEDGAEEGLRTVLTAQSDGGWRCDGANVSDDGLVRGLMEDLTSLSLVKCVDYRPSGEAASICGFDAPSAVVTIVYEPASGGEEEALVLTMGERLLDRSGRYVRIGGEDPTIYALSTGALDPLMRIAAQGLES